LMFFSVTSLQKISLLLIWISTATALVRFDRTAIGWCVRLADVDKMCVVLETYRHGCVHPDAVENICIK